MNGRLAGKVTIITGAASGIGEASAMLFASEGAKLVIADVSDQAGEALADRIRAQGGEAIYTRCDVSDRGAVAAMVELARSHYGRLDCAFNNAGICIEGDGTWNDEQFDRTVAINLTGVMNCVKAEVAAMLQNGGGTIVNSSSIAGLTGSGNPSQPGYTATKHAVIGLTKTAALTHVRANIRVNALCPGVTMTPMVAGVMALSDEIRTKLENAIPMGRPAHPVEMAEAALWLLSDKSSFVTGHALVADGGHVIA